MRLIKKFACSLECNLLLMDPNSVLGHFYSKDALGKLMLFDCQKLEKNIDGFSKDAIYCEIFKGLNESLCIAYIYKQIHTKEQSIDCCCVLLW